MIENTNHIRQRWLRIIPVALVMYTISYVDRTNVSLALDPKISSMMRDLVMDDRMKGQAAGIFFLGYVLLQMAGVTREQMECEETHQRVLVFLGRVRRGLRADNTFYPFEIARFLLGVSESGFFPPPSSCWPLVSPARNGRGRTLFGIFANRSPWWPPRRSPAGYWARYGWKTMLIMEGALPFLWLPIWWFFISDHPREAKWISPQERNYCRRTLEREIAAARPASENSLLDAALRWEMLVMVAIYFLHNCAAYGCMVFFTDGLKAKNFSAVQYGFLFAAPYAVTAVIML